MSPIKKIAKKGQIYHIYYRRSGGYKFIGKNSLKLLASLAVFGLLAFLFNSYVFNIAKGTEYITTHFSTPVVLAIFQLSELTHGLLAPEIFMTWASGFEHPWLWLFFLANISYLGGLGAYFIGRKLDKLPKVHNWVHVKFEEQFEQLKKFGGLLIIVAAFTPLPYSPICMVSGIIKFPLRSFLIATISRYIRFLIYGFIIFKVMA